WVRSVTDTLVTADLEVCHPDGTVWARITGWTDRRFRTDATIFPLLRWPEANRIAEAQPGGWFLLHDRWADPANRELIMRRYLGASERRRYEKESPRGRHRWLLGRIAVKDALRQWHWDGGAGPLFPAEFAIENEASGRPVVPGRPERISIAHTGDVAVALVGRGAVGIDVEAVEERSPQFAAMACTAAERALLDGTPVDLTRFWTAKEAVAKAVGTGLGGKPHRFEVVARDAGELLVAALDHGSRWRVETAVIDGATQYVVGWTAAPAGPHEAGAAAPATFSPLERTSNGR
ncbi:MAG TPA: 4'-phosphopantetheinyl transferase superfamily protein, partial [Acidimicrobiales bacterium]|nr:4'-phosphopantetheinyl transferase superfamily protein [Acidimicrobiales bacterium]